MKKNWFIAVTIILCSCNITPKKIKNIIFSVDGVFNRKELLLKNVNVPETNHSDSAKSYLKLKIKNETDDVLILPCQKMGDVLMYNPFRVKYYVGSSNKSDGVSIIDCFSCNHRIRLSPSDSIELYSSTSTSCKESSEEKLTFFYPFVSNIDTTMTQFFELDCVIKNCQVNFIKKVQFQKN